MRSDISTSPVTITTLPANGLRVVHRICPGPVEYFGVAVDAGSRDELPGEEGLAHFVEHTIFKGTGRRRSWHIINRMEAVGGELNAYTTKEETMVYTIFPKGNLLRAADLVADLITGSVFPQAELDKEREVVIDEINSYLDTPSDCVFDDFDDLFFSGTSLGHNILGTVETVRGFSSGDCLRWLRRCYVPSRMVVFYMGPEKPEKVFRLVERLFALPSSGSHPSRHDDISPSPSKAAFHEVRQRDSHQAHTVMGAPIPGIYSPQRLTMALINNIIGGPGMNSLLNIELRERRGLVYSVDASTSLYTDAGVMTIYFGCDPDDTRRCTTLVNRALEKLQQPGAIRERMLQAAKRQYAGQLVVASENKEQLALSTARTVLRGLEVLSTPRLIESVMAIPASAVADCMEYIHPDRFSSLTLQ